MGKTSIDHPPSSIKERIQLWQEQGGGVVELGEATARKSDTYSQYIPEELDASRSNTQTPLYPVREQRGPLYTPSGRSEKRLLYEATQADSRPRSAPTKRVISDGHWRKHGREAKGPLPGKEVDENITLHDEERNEETPAGMIDFPAQASLVERRERRKRRTRSVLEMRQPATSENSIREYVRSNVSQISNDLGKENLVRPEPVMNSSSHHANLAQRQKRRSLSNEFQAESSPGATLHLKDQKSLRSEKGNVLRRVLSDSRKALARQPSEPVVTPRIPSIQAWLESTPDPFAGDGLLPANSMSSHERLVSLGERGLKRRVEDSNHIWEAVNHAENKTHREASMRHRSCRSPLTLDPEENVTKEVGDSNTNLVSDAQIEDHRKTGSPLTANAELPSRSLKRRQARKSTSSTVTRFTRASPSSSTIEGLERGLGQASLQAEPSTQSVSPIVRRKRTKDRKQSLRKGRDACITAVEQPAATESKHDTINETSSLALDQTTDLVHAPQRPSNEDDARMSSLGRRTSRLTSHSDLISVLSMPRHNSKTTRLARPSRGKVPAPDCLSGQDIMLQLEKEEIKYTRELRTLIDGVVPVLLTCVLSKAESAVAAGLFRSPETAAHNPNFTRPIVDMAIALERLKSLHRRMPSKETSFFLTWAHGAKRVYAEYLKAWRLGFQDVIVNLAPAAEAASTDVSTTEREGLPRDLEGDVVDGNGEKVDVAFLLKRPLVRLKHLARTIKAINTTSSSAEAAQLTLDYDSLVENARVRVEEERARLEDEAAACIDATRSRDPRSLAPLNGVLIDSSRRVRARDYFSCTLQHSTGQSLDCQIELILREEAADVTKGGDLLICEVDECGRWLLFPPISSSCISARVGETKNEMVLMIRSPDSIEHHWQEMLFLTHFIEPTVTDWKNMLGSDPVPPAILRSQSFVSKGQARPPLPGDTKPSIVLQQDLETPGVFRPPSPSEVQVPIGEQANTASCNWPSDSALTHKLAKNVVAGKDLCKEENDIGSSHARQDSIDATDGLKNLPSQQLHSLDPFSSDSPKPLKGLKERLGLGGIPSTTGLRRNNAKRQSRLNSESDATFTPSSPQAMAGSRDSSPDTCDGPKIRRGGYEPENPGGVDDLILREGYGRSHLDPTRQDLPAARRQSKSPRDRAKSRSIICTAESAVIDQEHTSWKAATRSRDSGSHQSSPTKKPATPSHLQSFSSSPSLTKASLVQDSSFIPDPLNVTSEGARLGRSSSPLKRQLDPSLRSDTSVPESDLEDLASARDDVSSVTESSDDDGDLEADDVPMPLMPPVVARRAAPGFPHSSAQFTPEGSIKPSDSASQAPFKTVPVQPREAVRTVASLFAWSDKGSWEMLHPDECSIVVSPGLIEAFEMSAAHSSGIPLLSTLTTRDKAVMSDDTSQTTGQNDDVQGERPLVGLELTPLVPLRRGTAIDISIRSPPTSKSRITTSNNLMFRSRSAEECELLYSMINHARIHNPTYIALQNARGPFFMGATYADAVARRPGSEATSSRSSWFGGLGRSSSYRAKSKRTPSISPSQSSVGTVSSAFSALRRFGRGNGGKFNIALSTISSRQGIGSDPGTFSISDGSSAKDIATPVAPGMVANNDGSLGLKDAKIRLYLRENASRWRDLGSARLTILQPESDTCGLRGDGQIMHEKRILIHGKTKGEVLLDTQLGESSFERVARTGIAMSIWEDVVGPNGEVGRAGAIGGVAAVKTKIYMIQLKSEAETAYTFSLVGKLRY